MKPWLFIGCYSGNGIYNYYKSDIGSGVEWSPKGTRHKDIIGDRKLEEDGKYECDQC